MIALITSIVGFLTLVVGEIFEKIKAARIANEKFELDREKMLAIFDQALVRMREQGRADSIDAGKSDDKVDGELNHGPK